MTITIFVSPKTFKNFINITTVLRGLPPENNFKFNPNEIEFSEKFNPEWIWVNMEVGDYMGLKYKTLKMS